MKDYGIGRPMLTTHDAARLLNVHMNTVRRWTNEGILKAYYISPRGDRRFSEEDIVGFLTKQSEQRGRYVVPTNRGPKRRRKK